MDSSLTLEELTTRAYDLDDAHSALRADATDLYMRLLDAAWDDLETVFARPMFEHSHKLTGKSSFVRPNREQVAVMRHLIGLCDLLDTVRPIYQQNGRYPEPSFHEGIDLCSRRIGDIRDYAVMQIATFGMDEETLSLCLSHVLKPWLAVKHIMEERDDANHRVEELRSLVLDGSTAEDASGVTPSGIDGIAACCVLAHGQAGPDQLTIVRA